MRRQLIPVLFGLPSRTALPAGTIYFSALSFGGIPLGSDANAGTSSAPDLTVDGGFADTSSGGTMAGNGNPKNPTGYRHATFLTANKSITIQPVYPYGWKLWATTATLTRVMNVTVSGGTVNVGKIIIDAETNYQGCVTYADTVATLTVNYTGTKFLNWLFQGSISAGTSTKLAITYTNTIHQSDQCRTAIHHKGLIAGSSLMVDGATITIARQTTSAHGGIVAEALAASLSATVKNSTVSVTLDPSLGGAGSQHIGVLLYNFLAALIQDTTIYLNGSPGTRKGPACSIQTSLDANEQTIDGGIIRRVYAYNGTNGGTALQLGDDLQTRAIAVGLLCEDSEGYGSAAFVAGGGHLLFVCQCTSPIARRLTLGNGGLGIVDKLNTGGDFNNIAVSDCDSSYDLMKGTTNSVHDTITITAHAGFSGKMFFAEDDGAGTNTTGGQLKNSTFTVAGATNIILAYVATGSDVAFSNNVYNLISGSLNATPFHYQGADMTPAQWKALIEPTATGNIF